MKMCGKNLKCLATIAFICVFVWSFSLENCHGREGRRWGAHRKTGGYRHHHVHVDSEDVVGASLASEGGSGSFNVVDFGAKGDGKEDDTKVNLGLPIIFIKYKSLGITTLHSGMILSTLSVNSRGFTVGFLKKSHTNEDVFLYL